MTKSLSAAVACVAFASSAQAVLAVPSICLRPAHHISHVADRLPAASSGQFDCKQFLSTAIVARPAFLVRT